MAQAAVLTFGKQLMLLGDGDSTEQFASPCGFESLSMTVQVNTNETNVPDCADPDLAAWLVSSVVSQQMILSGTGVLDTDAMQDWRDWFMDNKPRNVRWKTEGAKADGGGYFEAPAIISAYEETGQRGQLWQISVTINLNDKPVWTDAAA